MFIAHWWQGRTQRGGFCFNTIAFWAIFYIVCSLLGASGSPSLLFVVSLMLVLAVALQCARRLHDLGRSSWWLLAVLVPVAGPLWLVWQLAFKQGQSHTNRWGDRPGRY